MYTRFTTHQPAGPTLTRALTEGRASPFSRQGSQCTGPLPWPTSGPPQLSRRAYGYRGQKVTKGGGFGKDRLLWEPEEAIERAAEGTAEKVSGCSRAGKPTHVLSSERGFEPFCDVWEVTHFEAEGLVPEISLFPNGFASDVAHSSLSSVREL